MSYDFSILTFRIQHDGGLKWENLKTGSKGIQFKRLRDKPHSRLWNKLDYDLQDAWIELENIFKAKTSGLGMKTFNPMRSRCKGDLDVSAVNMALYSEWVDRVRKNNLNYEACIDILFDCKSINDVAKRYRVRNRAVRNNLIGCLTQYCKIKGWK